MNKILNWIDFECYDIKAVLADTDFYCATSPQHIQDIHGQRPGQEQIKEPRPTLVQDSSRSADPDRTTLF